MRPRIIWFRSAPPVKIVTTVSTRRSIVRPSLDMCRRDTVWQRIRGALEGVM